MFSMIEGGPSLLVLKETTVLKSSRIKVLFPRPAALLFFASCLLTSLVPGLLFAQGEGGEEVDAALAFAMAAVDDSTQAPEDSLAAAQDSSAVPHDSLAVAQAAQQAFLDSLAASGVLFENAISASSWTKPSVTSILTGLTPNVHTLTDMCGDREIIDGQFSPQRILMVAG